MNKFGKGPLVNIIKHILPEFINPDLTFHISIY